MLKQGTPQAPLAFPRTPQHFRPFAYPAWVGHRNSELKALARRRSPRSPEAIFARDSLAGGDGPTNTTTQRQSVVRRCKRTLFSRAVGATNRRGCESPNLL